MSKRKTTEEFIAEAKAVHGDKYDYSKVNYKSAHSLVTQKKDDNPEDNDFD